MKLMEHRYGAKEFVTSKDYSLLALGTYYLTKVYSKYRRFYTKKAVGAMIENGSLAVKAMTENGLLGWADPKILRALSEIFYRILSSTSISRSRRWNHGRGLPTIIREQGERESRRKNNGFVIAWARVPIRVARVGGRAAD